MTARIAAHVLQQSEETVARVDAEFVRGQQIQEDRRATLVRLPQTAMSWTELVHLPQ